jgi:prolyl-tRNA synthetase
MLWSKSLIPTLRQVPGEAVVPSHQLMLRAGMVQQVAAGSYTYLPLGWRALKKVIDIIREEMDAAGAVEVLMPTLQPIELWEQTGRREAYGDNLFVVEDRHGRHQALGPTHEEVVTDLIKRTITSWRSLPLTLYQIQTKFRDEFRPRFGVLRSREFQMKDAYSFDLDKAGLDKSYDAMFEAYYKIFKRCGLNFVTVEAESGPIGGSASHEFMVPSPTGEDTILASDKGNYAANVEKCEIGTRPFTLDGAPKGELTKVHTPNMATIEDVGKFMKVKPKSFLKTLVYKVSSLTAEKRDQIKTLFRQSHPGEITIPTDVAHFIAVVRGDHEVNESKLRALVSSTLPAGNWDIALTDEKFAEQFKFPIGWVGPHLITTNPHISNMWIDSDAAQDTFWAAGANEVDQHVKYFNWKRDVLDPLGDKAKDAVMVADIRNAVDGDWSPRNDGGTLRASKGIEIGHVFKLGTKYTDALGVTVTTPEQQPVKVVMGCYGIGVNRILASAIEADAGHDDKGIIWPMNIAPYQVCITPIKYEGDAKRVADEIYSELTEVGVDVILDDREERPGVKFTDADLIGIPLRITVGDKGLASGQVELKLRTARDPTLVGVGEAVVKAIEIVRGSM